MSVQTSVLGHVVVYYNRTSPIVVRKGEHNLSKINQPPKKAFYVKNADLLEAVIAAKKKGVVTDELAKMLFKIAERYSFSSSYIGYTFREDMVASAVANLCAGGNALKFDETKYKNPFAYYTTAVYNSFLQYIAEEKKQRNIRDALLVEAGQNPSFNFLESERPDDHGEISLSDDLDYSPPEDDTPVAEEKDEDNGIADPKEEKKRGRPVKGVAGKVVHEERFSSPVTVFKSKLSLDANGDPITDEAGNFVIEKEQVKKVVKIDQKRKKPLSYRAKMLAKKAEKDALEAAAIVEADAAIEEAKKKKPAVKKTIKTAPAKKPKETTVTPTKKPTKTVSKPAKKPATKPAKKPAK